MRVKVLDPAPAGTTLAYSPLPAPLLALTHHGVSLGLDLGVVDYSRIRLVAGFEESAESAKTGRAAMLLFLDDRRRPISVDSEGIQNAEGQGPARLRDTIRRLLARNPRIALDDATFRFLCGDPLRRLDRDVVAVASAIGTALARAAMPDPAVGGPPP